jgi:predicted porin
MKKFALSLVAVASMSAFAQSEPSVTIYGIVDAGVQRVTGYKKGTDTALVSGIMEGSRFGLRGNEDLGGGYRAFFTLENRTELNTGTVNNRPPSGSQLPDYMTTPAYVVPSICTPPVAGPYTAACAGMSTALSQLTASVGSAYGVNVAGAFWDRQAFVGLVTPYGAIIAGRQYTPAYEVNGTFDIMGTQSSLSAGQVASFPPTVDIRVSNALQYRIQLGGLTANAFYAFGGVSGNNKANRMMGAMAMYKTGGYAVGLGYNTRNNADGDKALSSTVFGASAAIGPGTVSGLYGVVKNDHPFDVATLNFATNALTPNFGGSLTALIVGGLEGALQQDGRLMHIGYKMPIGTHTLYVAYSSYNDRRVQNADTASYGVAYTYALSKRTDINAVVTHFNNKGLGQMAPGQAGFLGGVTAAAGTDSNSVALGIRHRF